MDDWESSPDSVKGEGAGAELVRTIRKIAQIKNRLETIKKEMTALKQSELYHLMIKIEEEKKAGRDILAEMAREINKEIKIAEEKLDKLKAGIGVFALAFLVKTAEGKNIFILKFNGTALIGVGLQCT